MSADYKFTDANHEVERGYVENRDPTNKVKAEYILVSAETIIHDISKIKINKK